MKNIGLLFGSFNPLHNGHVMLAEAAKQDMKLDEVWFVVQPQNIYKPTFDLLDLQTRKDLIIKSGYKVYNPTSTDYAHLILESLRELTGSNLTLLLGEDLAASFPTWPDYDHIKQLAEIYQSHRIDGISSGLIRDKLMAGESIDNLVPQPVANYQKQHSG